jgi:segregation and condensation protein B
MALTTDPTPDPQQEGISLDELAQAFAEVMSKPPKAKVEAETLETPDEAALSSAPSDQQPGSESQIAPEPPPIEDSCPISPRAILEAMLFVGDRGNCSLSAARAAELMRGVEPGEIDGLIEELNRHYARSGCPYEIVRDGEGCRLVLRKQFFALRDRFYGRVREAKLSQAAVDILAIVAYQQPLTPEQISTMRGKPSSHVLSQLVRRGLLRTERQPGKRRAVQYFTTDRFLTLFGLETLAELPQSEELERQ